MPADENPLLQAPLEIDEDIVEKLRTLQAIASNDVPKVPEAIFVQHILPVMTDRSGKVNLSRWVDVAGHAQRPIDVVDARGVVLFRVPALLQSYPTRSINGVQDSFLEHVQMSKKKIDIHPLMGSNYLTEGLLKRVIDLGPNHEVAQTWSDILARYGYSMPGLPTPTAPVTQRADASETPNEPTPLFGDVDEEI